MKKLLFILITVTLGFSSCKKVQDITASPEVKFSTNIVAGQEPHESQSIQLTNSSTDNCIYSWDFGNGTTSFEKNPTVSYKMHGIYLIKLTVTNEAGKSISTFQNATVLCNFKGNNHNAEPL